VFNLYCFSKNHADSLSVEIVILLRTSGILLALATVLLQFAVFLQPLLPEQYQIAPVCELISQVIKAKKTSQDHNNDSSEQHSVIHHDLEHLNISQDHSSSGHSHHDLTHQCQYCTIYGNLHLPPEIDLKEILVRIQVRLLAYSESFKHIYFELQRLYLLPQGRAPPNTLQLSIV